MSYIDKFEKDCYDFQYNTGNPVYAALLTCEDFNRIITELNKKDMNIYPQNLTKDLTKYEFRGIKLLVSVYTTKSYLMCKEYYDSLFKEYA